MTAKKNTEKKTRATKKKDDAISSLSEFSISMLRDYYDVCENVLKHYENELFANKNTNDSAYKAAKENYDMYLKIHGLLFTEIERRLKLIC